MSTTTHPKKPASKAKFTPGGTITLPDLRKPSQVLSKDRTRPMLTHGYLRHYNGELWLLTTDSYIALATPVTGSAGEGWMPGGALKLIERGNECEQLSETSWKVFTADGYSVFECAPDVRGTKAYPDLAALGLFNEPALTEAPSVFGFDPKLLSRLAAGLGADRAVKFRVPGPRKPIMVRADGKHNDSRGMLMPVRVDI